MKSSILAPTRTKRLGMVIPSSNTVLEPETAKLLPPDGSITCHVSRLRVVTISAEHGSRSQFDTAAILAATGLLADARVDLILWNGTAASWLGFDFDQRLVATIEAETGIPATTAVIAINDKLAQLDARRIGLVTPYIAGLEADIIRNYAGIGMDVVAAQRLDLTDNLDFGAVPPARVAEMIRAVARSLPEAIVVMCTNLAGASLTEPLSRELGLPVIDSVRAAFDHSVARLQAGG